MHKVYSIFILVSEAAEDESFGMFGESLIDDNPIQIVDGDEVILYAFSDNKKFVNDFINSRDKKKFIVSKRKMDDDQWSEYYRVHFEYNLIQNMYSFHDQSIPVTVTIFEDNMYNSMYDGIDDELSVLNDNGLIESMITIYTILRKKYADVCDQAGIANVINSIEGIDNGEPVYLEPDFFKFMMIYFKFTF